MVSANYTVTLTGTYNGMYKATKKIILFKNPKRHKIERVYVCVVYSRVTLRLTNDTAADSWLFNLLQTKRNLLYIKNQFVPRCKHFPPRL
jgi:3-polyprenyl-4-hydroxybenzoate decarboxylase